MAIALSHGDVAVTWAEFDARTNQVADALIKALGPGRSVSAFSPRTRSPILNYCSESRKRDGVCAAQLAFGIR